MWSKLNTSKVTSRKTKGVFSHLCMDAKQLQTCPTRMLATSLCRGSFFVSRLFGCTQIHTQHTGTPYLIVHYTQAYNNTIYQSKIEHKTPLFSLLYTSVRRPLRVKERRHKTFVPLNTDQNVSILNPVC